MNFMNKNRFLAMMTAGALAATMSVPAFAADANTTVLTGTYEDIPIEVTVPQTGTVQINPYGLDVKLGTTNSKISGQQIVTQPLAIINNSQMNLSVGAEVTGKITDGSTMTLSPTTTKELTSTAATKKTAFVYFQMAETTLKQANLNADGSVKEADFAPVVAAWEAEYTPETDVVVGTKAVKKDNIITLTAGTVNAADDTKTDVAEGGIAMFRLSGDCIANPTGGWAETDGFETTVAFSFSVAAE